MKIKRRDWLYVYFSPAAIGFALAIITMDIIRRDTMPRWMWWFGMIVNPFTIVVQVALIVLYWRTLRPRWERIDKLEKYAAGLETSEGRGRQREP